MSIKILLISKYNNLTNEMQKNYSSHLNNGFFTIFNPKDMDTETYYDIIIAEEEYIPIITIKNIPVIIIKKEDSKLEDNEYENFCFITSPIDWQNLYDKIISLQYVHKNQDLKLFHKPEIQNITTENTTIIPINSTLEGYNTNQLSTKIYNPEDITKITKILQNYGEENYIDKKIIAQASIILDELIFLIKSMQNENKTFNSNNPAILLQIENKNEDFIMNVECKVKSSQFQNVVAIAQDYGNTVRSFERNNSNILNIQWHL